MNAVTCRDCVGRRSIGTLHHVEEPHDTVAVTHIQIDVIQFLHRHVAVAIPDVDGTDIDVASVDSSLVVSLTSICPQILGRL